ncbi:hypothetical protein HDE_12941 [Halotydeus destructor]|nr:hypothetical protein HDE_12941 [Halotydeus destructor]
MSGLHTVKHKIKDEIMERPPKLKQRIYTKKDVKKIIRKILATKTSLRGVEIKNAPKRASTPPLFLSVYESLLNLARSRKLTLDEALSDPHSVDSLVQAALGFTAIHCRKNQQKLDFWAMFNENFKFDLVLNSETKVLSSILNREVIYAMFTKTFVGHEDYCVDDKTAVRKRYACIIVNQDRLVTVLKQYMELVASTGNQVDSGVFDMTRLNESSNVSELDSPEFSTLLLIITYYALHCLGHIDLYFRNSFCFYENHGASSAFFSSLSFNCD